MTKTKINKKPATEIAAKSVLNLNSGFKHKKLCTGPTFTAGNACVYNCEFCYVPQLLSRNPKMIGLKRESGLEHSEMVVRRSNPVELLKKQLLTSDGKWRKQNHSEHVVYTSPLVDCAPTLELMRETAEMSDLILENTNWNIRFLSKSANLLKLAHTSNPRIKGRGIFGHSTGTLDDRLASSFERGTALVSKRIKDHRHLQDEGHRTFGMVCPIIPQRDYDAFAEEVLHELRVEHCEHVWVEVLNARGASLSNTTAALKNKGYDWEAEQLTDISRSRELAEEYARRTFLAFHQRVPHARLRFLQYVSKDNLEWWRRYENEGAVLLGKHAKT